MRGYRNFDLFIEPKGGKYEAIVLSSPSGETRGPCGFPFPFSEHASDWLVDRSSIDSIQAFGARLFEAAFCDSVRECFHRSINEAERAGKGLRLRLRMPGAPELAGLPWEYLYDPLLNHFLALTTETPVVRYLDVPNPVEPLGIQPPLRILAVLSNPQYNNLPCIDIDQEWRNLLAALQPLIDRKLVSLTRLENPTLTALQKELRQTEFHIFHFTGHGVFSASRGTGMLLFEDETGQGDPVTGADLSIILHDHPSLRLAILHACEGAVSSTADLFSGTAQTLVRQELPAVIAMQFQVSSRASIDLASAFYGALADGCPVDEALTEARKAMKTHGDEIEWGTPTLFLRSPDGRLFDLAKSLEPVPMPTRIIAPSETQKPAEIFISYRRASQPDRALAEYLHARLTQHGHRAFIDAKMRVGTEWLREIDEKIKASDYLIVLISKESADSEMVQAEIQRAYEYRIENGRPQTLPVRMDFSGRLPYTIAFYLHPYQQIFWQSPADNERVAAEILDVLAGQAAPASAGELSELRPPAAAISEDGREISSTDELSSPLPAFDPRILDELDDPGGVSKLGDRFYIERDSDARLIRQVQRVGTTTTIRASRQTGKTSLLARGIHHARANAGARVVHLDLQSVEHQDMANANSFLHHLAASILRQLRMDPDEAERVWADRLGPQDKITLLMEEHVLPASEKPLTLAIDEADRLLDVDFHSDFFSLLRSWHNKRAIDMVWNQFNLVMVISTEPYLLISSGSESPFNVGLALNLEDFNQAQVRELNQRHGSPVKESDFPDFYELLKGHPYLTRKALYGLVTGPCTWSEFAQTAVDDLGPFGDHLRRQQWLLRDDRPLQAALKQVAQQNRCDDQAALHRLLRAGLVKGRGDTYFFRCGLYERYFKDKLR